MKKILLALLLLLVPGTTYATTTIPWISPGNLLEYLQPNRVNGTNLNVYIPANLGIGTTSPYAALSVVGSTGVVMPHFNATSTVATSTVANELIIGGTRTTNQRAILSDRGVRFTRPTDGIVTGTIQVLGSASSWGVNLDGNSNHTFSSGGTSYGSIGTNVATVGTTGIFSVDSIGQLRSITSLVNNTLTINSDDAAASVSGLVLNRTARSTAKENAITSFRYAGTETNRITTDGNLNLYGTSTLGTATAASIARLGIFATSTQSTLDLFDVMGPTNTPGVATSTLFVIKSTGFVGIGTSSPGSKLAVQGTTTLLGYTTCGKTLPPPLAGLGPIQLDCWGDSDGYVGYVFGNKNTGTFASSDILLNNNASTDTADYGDLGINGKNNTDPAYTGLGGPSAVYLYSATGNQTYSVASTSLTAYQAWNMGGLLSANEKMRLTGAGNLGIGTTTPQVPLNVVRTGNGARTWTPSAGTVALFDRSSTGTSVSYVDIVSGSAAAGRLHFGDTESETSGILEYDHSTDQMSMYAGGNRVVKVINDKVGITLGSTLVPTGRLDMGTGTSGECITWSSSAIVQYSSYCVSRSGAKTVLGAGIRTSTTTNDLLVDSAETTMGQAAIVMNPFGTTGERGNIGFFTSANTARTWNATTTMVEQMRLTNLGYLGIGATTTAGVATKLYAKTGCTNTTTTTLDACNLAIVNSDQTVNNMQGIAFRQTNSVGTDVAAGRISVINTDHTSTSEDAEMAFFTVAAGTFAEKMRIDSAGDVGIGTTSPYAKLSVTNTGSLDSFIVEDSTSPDATRFIIDAAGNVGIGVPSITAGAALDVEGNVRIGQNFDLRFNNTNVALMRSANDLLIGAFNDVEIRASAAALSSQTTRIKIIGNTGFIGMGTSTPAANLDINNGSVVTVDSVIRLEGTLSASGAGHSIDWYAGSGNVGAAANAYARIAGITSGGEGHLTFYTNTDLGSAASTERMRIVGGTGNVGIGTTSPFRKLSVSGTTGNNYLTFDNTSDGILIGDVVGEIEFNQTGDTSTMTTREVANIKAIAANTYTGTDANGTDLVFSVKPNGSVVREVMRIGGVLGYVGIGTSTATKTLSVAGYAEVKVGTATSTANLGGVIFATSTDAGNQTTVETDLVNRTIKSNTFAVTNESVESKYTGTFVSSGTATRQVKVYFGGTTCFDTGAITISSAAVWTLEVELMRSSATAVRCSANLSTTGASLGAYTGYVEVTGLNLAGDNTFRVTGTAAGVGAATNDIVVKMGKTQWLPVAN